MSQVTENKVIAAPVPMTPLQEFWHYFKRNKGAVVGLVYVVVMIVIAVFANFLAPYNPADQFRDSLLAPPFWQDGGSLAHLLLQLGNQILQLFFAHGFRILLQLHLCFCNSLGNGNQVTDRFLDGSRCDTVLLIISFLDFPSAVGFFNGVSHGVRHHICVHNNMAITVSGSTSNGLDQGSFGTEKALAI